jgi:hypothetical protein
VNQAGLDSANLQENHGGFRTLFSGYLGPRVAKRNDAVENEPFGGRVFHVDTEIPEPFKLVPAPGNGIFQARLDIA